jgi:hypothetical protein
VSGEGGAEALMSALRHLRRTGATRAQVRAFTERVSQHLETRQGAPAEMRALLARAGELVHDQPETDPGQASAERRRFLDLMA